MKRNISNLKHWLLDQSNRQKVIGLIVVAAVGVLGVVFLLASHAATTSVSLEAESGTLSGSAAVATDSNASGGKYVKFAGGGDTTPPTVSMTAPTSGTKSGTITLSASASDNVGVTKVEFYAGTTLLKSLTSSPYNYSWDTTTVADGAYNLKAKAYDAASNVGTSAAVSVTVSNSVTPPPPPPPPPPPGSLCGFKTTAPPATYQHVVWIWMENQHFADVIGNSAAPYITSLSKACGYATNEPHNASPSLPNYIAATSGSAFGIADDNPPSSHILTNDNLFRQVRALGKTVKSYQEDMSGNCSGSKAGNYAPKHNPEAYYTGGSDRTECQKDNIPMGTLSSGALISDINNDSLPTFSFITPNICNDMHSCAVSVGDSWIKTLMPKLVNMPSYQAGNTVIWLIWDDYPSRPNVMLGATVKPGTVYSATSVDHYSELRTTEEQLGITNYLLGAGSAPSVRKAFNW